jgi:hypothetical protein
MGMTIQSHRGQLGFSAKGGKDKNTLRVSMVAFGTACTARGLKQKIIQHLKSRELRKPHPQSMSYNLGERQTLPGA